MAQNYVWVVYYGTTSVYEHTKVFTNKVKAMEFKYTMWNKGYQVKMEKEFN